jgi:hypothetical protein
MNIILANITWNSKNWKEPSEDVSGHQWVGGENIPHESWNFDLDNVRNTDDKVYGFAKFTHPPKVEGNNNLIVFYSQNKIVGFYGKAEILKEWIKVNEQESYNLIGDKNLSIVLNNKIEGIKEKGYLENKERVGQVGFSYLKKTETALNILEESIALNPEQKVLLEKIKNWVECDRNESHNMKEIEIEYPSSFNQHGQFQTNFRTALKIPNEVSKVNVIFNSHTYKDLTLGIEGSGRGRIYFNNKKSDFIQNNTQLIGGERIKIQVTYNENSSNINPLNMSNKIDLNQIFFGPPGTGKTYHTINEAIKIADPVFYQEHKDDRDKLKERFKLLLLNNDNEDIGQIGFTTFHQSFSYEDFIEGIKPLKPLLGDTYLKYDIREGVFKRICRLANDSIKAKELESKNLINLNEEEFEKTQFYKISLGNTQLEEDKEIFGYCIKNNCITIGFGEGKNLEGLGEKDIRIWGKEKNQSDDSIRSLNYFKNFLKIGHYILVSNGNHYCRAIGKVVGEYEYQESPFSDNSTYNHFRKIEWLVSGEDIPVKDLYYKNFTQKTIYNLEKSEIKKEFFIKGIKSDLMQLPKNPKNFVLVIDEINRGNVSSIFGELITLIEKDKRAGTEEELSVTLPYSKKEFKVPQNVYIIGTMNTADRSIEALDTALRRRFSFREMPPKPELIVKEGKLKDKQGKVGDIDVVRILETINDRIEKLIDKDHKIGHSYFLGVSDENELKAAFKNKVIPLLEEYFFGDFGKISLVLGSSFITKTTKANVAFAKNNEYDPSIAADLLERSVYEVTESINWDFKAIYE